MQTVTRRDLAKRARYYQGVMDVDSLERGGLYTHLKDNYVIFLCMGDIFGQGLPVYSFENVCTENPGLKLDDRTYKVFFNAKEYDKMPGKELREFFRYVYENTPPGSEFVSDIDSKVRLAKTSADTRRLTMTWGQEIALAVEEATADAEERTKIAVENATKETSLHQSIETAKRFLAMKFTPKQVAQGTGLSLEQVIELQKTANLTEQ